MKARLLAPWCASLSPIASTGEEAAYSVMSQVNVVRKAGCKAPKGAYMGCYKERSWNLSWGAGNRDLEGG